MRKIGSLIVHGLISAGMIYALISFFALPANACTPTFCAGWTPQTVRNFCNFEGCGLSGGQLDYCDSSGWEVQCYGCPPGSDIFAGTC